MRDSDSDPILNNDHEKLALKSDKPKSYSEGDCNPSSHRGWVSMRSAYLSSNLGHRYPSHGGGRRRGEMIRKTFCRFVLTATPFITGAPSLPMRFMLGRRLSYLSVRLSTLKQSMICCFSQPDRW